MKNSKTNVMRVLESRGVPYECFFYDADPALSGSDIARILGENPAGVFKTLVAKGAKGRVYVFMVPVSGELDLKKAASVAGEKHVEMLKAKELLPTTGYVHGGCSPVGMKKKFDTFLDSSAAKFGAIYFSAGKIGAQVRLSPADLAKVVEYKFADISK